MARSAQGSCENHQIYQSILLTYLVVDIRL